jgi:hypothetical protein
MHINVFQATQEMSLHFTQREILTAVILGYYMFGMENIKFNIKFNLIAVFTAVCLYSL